MNGSRIVPAPDQPPPPVWAGYAGALGGVALTTALICWVPGATHVGNISFLYLLVVVVAAYIWGSGAAIAASVLAALAFDWFFVEPRHTLSVTNPAEWLALLIFLFTALVVSRLTQNLRLRAGQAQRRELETAALARVSWAVASQIGLRPTLEEVLRQLAEVIRSPSVAVIVRGEGDAVEVVTLPSASPLPAFERGQEVEVLRWLWKNGRAVPWSEHPFELEVSAAWVPLVLEGRVMGALWLWRSELQPFRASEQRVAQALANQVAVALERERQSHNEAAAEALLEADKLKSALLSMVSHDFRSPLAAIKAGVTGLLQEDLAWDDAAGRELLADIDSQTDRLNRMVGDILALSRLEANAWRPQREAVSVGELVGAALDGLSDEDNRRIRVDLEGGLPDAALDSVQIVQVLHNLLENALKYSPPETPVELCATRAGNELVWQVRDRGVGLPPDEEEQIFQKFYRARRWRESAVGGSGIGLAICRGLVEAHGGKLYAHPREGGGAVFSVSVPILPMASIP